MLKFKPPMCFNMEDAKFVVETIDKILTGKKLSKPSKTEGGF